MITNVTFDVAPTRERTLRGRKGMKARALLSVLVGCFAWLPFSSAAEAVPFQQYRNGVCNSSVCNIDFALVPANRRLDITNVSCYLRASEDVQLYAMQLLMTQAAVAQSAVTLVPVFVDGIGTTETVYSANHSIFAVARAGQRFRAYAELKAGSFQQFACHISGQLQPL